jgi:methyltransferase
VVAAAPFTVGGLDTRWLFLGLVGLVALVRLAELRLARRNTARALAAGGLEVGRGHYPVMVVVHAAFLSAAPLEVFLLERRLEPLVATIALAALVAAALLRVWVIATLGERWTTRIILFPDRPAIRRGPYRLVRHPNYLAVAVEIAALPLVHGAWLTAAVASCANAALLRHRIRVEEEGLRRHCDYDAVFGEAHETGAAS